MAKTTSQDDVAVFEAVAMSVLAGWASAPTMPDGAANPDYIPPKMRRRAGGGPVRCYALADRTVLAHVPADVPIADIDGSAAHVRQAMANLLRSAGELGLCGVVYDDTGQVVVSVPPLHNVGRWADGAPKSWIARTQDACGRAKVASRAHPVSSGALAHARALIAAANTRATARAAAASK